MDYAILTKKYVGDSNLPDAAHRYSPGHVAGVETIDHLWTIGELIAAALEPSDVPPLPRSVQPTTLRPGYVPFRPRVIQGGKMSKPRS